MLAIETSTAHGSVAVVGDGEVLCEKHFTAARGYSSGLFVALQEAWRDDVERVVVGLGPGSYSGVRIAIAAAMGLVAGRDVELTGAISAAALAVEPERYFAIGDARRESFYFAEIDARRVVEGPLLLTAEQLRGRLDDTPVFASEPLEKFPEAQLAFPSAAILAELPPSAHGDLEPLYLREPHITTPRATR